MRWLIVIALLLATTGCAGAPTASPGATSPTAAPAAAPKPSPQETLAPTAPATSASAPTAAPAAAPKPSPAGSVGPAGAASPTGGATGAGAAGPTAAAGAAPTGVAPTGAAPTGAAAPGAPGPGASPTVAFGRGTVTLTRADGATRQLLVEIAESDGSRERGLMFRPTMPEDVGMIFLFPQDIDGAFWMQNTLIPLSIAFVAADGRIVDIQDMQPLTTDFHRPPRPYRSALEVNQGYFARSGVKAGDRAELKRG